MADFFTDKVFEINNFGKFITQIWTLIVVGKSSQNSASCMQNCF